MQQLTYSLDLADPRVRAKFKARKHGVEQAVLVRSHECPRAPALRATGTLVTSYDGIPSYRIAVTAAGVTQVDDQTVDWLELHCEQIERFRSKH